MSARRTKPDPAVPRIVATVAAACGVAGAAVGAIHGIFLLRLLASRSAAAA